MLIRLTASSCDTTWTWECSELLDLRWKLLSLYQTSGISCLLWTGKGKSELCCVCFVGNINCINIQEGLQVVLQVVLQMVLQVMGFLGNQPDSPLRHLLIMNKAPWAFSVSEMISVCESVPLFLCSHLMLQPARFRVDLRLFLTWFCGRKHPHKKTHTTRKKTCSAHAVKGAL